MGESYNPDTINTELRPDLPSRLEPQNPRSPSDWYFNSSDRATRALSALTKLAEVTGKSEADMGAGYRYLRSILSATQNYGANTNEQMMTRANATKLFSALDPLLNQGKSDALSAYGPLATMLSKPFFSKGNLMPISKTADGRYIFGEANKALL